MHGEGGGVEGEKHSKDTYQDFFWVLIDLIIGFLGLIINPFDNQTERWA
jgi:hypothetical protein